MIRSRRITTLLCHPELEGAFSAGTKGVSIPTSLFLFGGPRERSTPFRLRPSEFLIFHTTEIPFAHCSHKYYLLTFWSHKACYKSFAIPIAYTGYDGCPSHHRFPQAKLIFPLDLPKKHQPLSSPRSPWNPHTLLSLLSDFSCRCFFFFIFSSPRNF